MGELRVKVILLFYIISELVLILRWLSASNSFKNKCKNQPGEHFARQVEYS